MYPASAAGRLRWVENGVGILLVEQVRLDKPPGAGQPPAARRRLSGSAEYDGRASRRSASAPRTAARLRARAATPWTCAQQRGRVVDRVGGVVLEHASELLSAHVNPASLGRMVIRCP